MLSAVMPVSLVVVRYDPPSISVNTGVFTAGFQMTPYNAVTYKPRHCLPLARKMWLPFPV